MRFTNLLLFLPTQLAPLLVVLGGIALILGAKKFATTMFVSVGALIAAPVVLGPLLAAVPWWLLILALPVMGALLVSTVVTALFGRRVWEEALGHWIARLIGPLWLITTAVVVLFTFL
jgi:uncharacterized membrane protein YwaF